MEIKGEGTVVFVRYAFAKMWVDMEGKNTFAPKRSIYHSFWLSYSQMEDIHVLASIYDFILLIFFQANKGKII